MLEDWINANIHFVSTTYPSAIFNRTTLFAVNKSQAYCMEPGAGLHIYVRFTYRQRRFMILNYHHREG